jgi:clan AA aspartic protease (TIGR02281 family)
VPKKLNFRAGSRLLLVLILLFGLMATASGRDVVPIKAIGNCQVVSAVINDAVVVDFTIDTGASYVTLTPDVLTTLQRGGTVSNTSFCGKSDVTLADGSKIAVSHVMLQTVRVGQTTATNVEAVVLPNVKGDLLLGQSFLSAVGKFTIDTQNSTLTFSDPNELFEFLGPNKEYALDAPEAWNIEKSKREDETLVISDGTATISVAEFNQPDDGLGDLKDRLTRTVWEKFSRDVETRRAQVFGPSRATYLPAFELKFETSTQLHLCRGLRYGGWSYLCYVVIPKEKADFYLPHCRKILDSFTVNWK